MSNLKFVKDVDFTVKDEHIQNLAKDICDPVYHLLPEEEWERWLEAVVQRLRRETGLKE